MKIKGRGRKKSVSTIDRRAISRYGLRSFGDGTEDVRPFPKGRRESVMDATSQKQGLQKLMRSRAPDSSLKDVARALFGLYVNIARDCAWPLVPASKLDASDLAKRLSGVLAVPVNQVRFISISAPYADAEWTTDEGYVALFEEGLAAGIERSVERD